MTPFPLHFRNKILHEAAQHVPELGFTHLVLRRSLDTLNNNQEFTDASISQMFDRGFPSALVEYIVKKSNQATHQDLEKKFNKGIIISAIAKNEQEFLANRYLLPTAQDVALRAITTKINCLIPYSSQWHNAVAIEYSPPNIPFTVINLAEFVDTTAFYIERVKNIESFLEPARRCLHSKTMTSFVPTSEKSGGPASSTLEDFLNAFIEGIPLSSSPNAGSDRMSCEWFGNRAKITAVYTATVTSLIGDTSTNKIETMNFAKSIVSSMF